MGRQVEIAYGHEALILDIPNQNYLYYLEPNQVEVSETDKKSVQEAISSPIECDPLSALIRPEMNVLLICDDNTRPTPKRMILEVLVEELTKAGMEFNNITILVALGTHRYMEEVEITETFGPFLCENVRIVNHEWAAHDGLVDLGATDNGTPIILNRRILDADFTIGVGSIVPHSEAGWSGGCKIVQPGISGWETTGVTHLLAAKDPHYLKIAGTIENNVRTEIDAIGMKAGLDFIVNVVMTPEEHIYRTVAGHPIAAHRAGATLAADVYCVPIEEPADVVIVSAYPADLDYWQGDKPVTYSMRGLRDGGTVILVGRFTEGISPSHPILGEYGTLTFDEVQRLSESENIDDKVGLAALYIHTHHLARASVICVSGDGFSKADKERLSLSHANTVDEALNIALKTQGPNATIGVINYGGDLLPYLNRVQNSNR